MGSIGTPGTFGREEASEALEASEPTGESEPSDTREALDVPEASETVDPGRRPMEVDSEVAGLTAEVVSRKRKRPRSEGEISVRASVRGGNDTAGVKTAKRTVTSGRGSESARSRGRAQRR